MNGTLGIDIWTVLSPIGVMVGIAFSSGGKELEDEDLFRLANLRNLDAYRFIAVEPFTDLKIESGKPMDPLLHQGDAPVGTKHESRCYEKHIRSAKR
jgi:hypothetical protein